MLSAVEKVSVESNNPTEMSSKDVCIKLRELCEKRENEEFVKLFTKHSLFGCVIGADWGDYWGSPGDYHAYAFYLAYYHKNLDLVDMLHQIAESRTLFRWGHEKYEIKVAFREADDTISTSTNLKDILPVIEANDLFKDNCHKEGIKRVRIYAAGASANFDDDLLRKIKRETLRKWNWLYLHFLEGLWHGKYYKKLSEELLSEKNRFWFGYNISFFEDPGNPIYAHVFDTLDDDTKRDLPFTFNESEERPVADEMVKIKENILISLGCKRLWLGHSRAATAYLKDPSEEMIGRAHV